MCKSINKSIILLFFLAISSKAFALNGYLGSIESNGDLASTEHLYFDQEEQHLLQLVATNKFSSNYWGTLRLYTKDIYSAPSLAHINSYDVLLEDPHCSTMCFSVTASVFDAKRRAVISFVEYRKSTSSGGGSDFYLTIVDLSKKFNPNNPSARVTVIKDFVSTQLASEGYQNIWTRYAFAGENNASYFFAPRKKTIPFQETNDIIKLSYDPPSLEVINTKLPVTIPEQTNFLSVAAYARDNYYFMFGLFVSKDLSDPRTFVFDASANPETLTPLEEKLFNSWQDFKAVYQKNQDARAVFRTKTDTFYITGRTQSGFFGFKTSYGTDRIFKDISASYYKPYQWGSLNVLTYDQVNDVIIRAGPDGETYFRP